MTGRFALVLGTASYRTDSKLTALPGVRHDVEQMKAVLNTDGGFDSVEAHVDLPATHMREIVERFYGARRTGDLALFYYSGHGVMHPDNQSLFLAAIDTDTDVLHHSALDVDGFLRHMINTGKAGQKAVFLDCCFSGAFSARHRFTGAVRQEPRRLKRERGTFMLQSSDHRKASKAQGPDKPSVFTEVLLDGLRGAAQGTADDGWITANDLARYAMSEMSRRRQDKPVESSEGVTEPIRLVAGPAGAPARHAPDPRADAPDDAPFDTDRWRRLLTYYADCLQRSAILQFFVNPMDNNSYRAAPAGREAVFSATGPLRLSGSGRQLATFAEAEGRSLQYGYPVVAMRQKGQQGISLAPLLVCDLTVGEDGLAHPEPPQPSPALIDHCQLAPVEADELRQAVAELLVPGDRASLAEAVRRVAVTFGLKPVADLDPENMTGAVQRGPLNRVQNSGMLFAAGSAQAPEARLVDDLRDIVKNAGKIAQTALGALSSPAADAPDGDVLTVALSPVNETQEEIIRAAMSRRLTVAQGPPGTGKSQLVTALLATATAAGESVLIGSTNNRAVDEVVDRVTGMVGPGLVLRTGNKEYLQREPEFLTDVIRAWPAPAPDARGPAQELRLLGAEMRQLRDDLDRRRLLERDLADLALERDLSLADLDDVVLARLGDLVDRALGSRWFGWWYRRRLRSRGILDREAITELGERVAIERSWRARRREHESTPGTVEEVWKRLRRLRNDVRPTYSDQLLRAQITARVTGSTTLLRNRADEMAKPTPRSWSYMPELLGALPGWAVTAMSARRLKPGAALFDLVIIDEAAQCTIPAIVPMLYRAKRALIIGDPRQLSPVAGLDRPGDRDEQVKAGLGHRWLTDRRLTYAEHSAYEAFATAAGSANLLDEHYRCHPEIIEAPNRVVYQNRLTVLTDPVRLAAPADPAIRWTHVPGRFSRGDTGGSGRNDAEVHAVVAEVRKLRKEYPDASIGVVTPLAAQQRLLDRALRDAGIGGDLLCATIHKFQGSEKDIMVVSPVAAQGINDRTRGWLVDQTNLWNVAITRARSQLIVVGDRSWWSGQRGLIAALAGPPSPAAAGLDTGSRPVDRLVPGLRAAGLTVGWATPLPAYPVDLTLTGRRSLAVVIDDPGGDPDGRALRRTLARLDVIAGTADVRRVPVWRCIAEPDQVVAELREAANRD